MKFDPRITPARPDLAAAHLKGKVEAARFVEGVVQSVITTTAPLRREPRHDALLETEALFGERVVVYEMSTEGWAWCQFESDGYVGYLPAAALARPGAAPTHRVSALRTLMFPVPYIKAPPMAALPFMSQVSVKREEGGFAVTGDGGFVFAKHLSLLARAETDFIATARKFLGVPYLWGGRSSSGLDCSGLVQLALQAAGIKCPRDSDLQAAIGKPVSFSGDMKILMRGDLMCWKGHIGFVTDGGRMLHANAFHMMVAEEPVQEAIERIRTSGSEVTAVRRLTVPAA